MSRAYDEETSTSMRHSISMWHMQMTNLYIYFGGDLHENNLGSIGGFLAESQQGQADVSRATAQGMDIQMFFIRETRAQSLNWLPCAIA